MSLFLLLVACNSGGPPTVRDDAETIGRAWCELVVRCNLSNHPEWGEQKIDECAIIYAHSVCHNVDCDAPPSDPAVVQDCADALGEFVCGAGGGHPTACDGVLL